MDVILLERIEKLGSIGDVVKVKNGYARNFLLPRKIAAPVTLANRKQVESLKKRRAERESQEVQGAQELAKKLEKTSIAFAVKTGEGGKMFGAITANDIHEKLAASGLEIDKRKIHLFTPVKTLGKHTVVLTMIGGGVFGNPRAAIWEAIHHALEEVEPNEQPDLPRPDHAVPHGQLAQPGHARVRAGRAAIPSGVRPRPFPTPNGAPEAAATPAPHPPATAIPSSPDWFSPSGCNCIPAN